MLTATDTGAHKQRLKFSHYVMSQRYLMFETLHKQLAALSRGHTSVTEAVGSGSGDKFPQLVSGY